MAKRRSIESAPKEESKTPLDLMWEAKKRAEEVARADKTGTAWNPINPDLITSENLDLWNHFQNGELEIARAGLDAAKENLDKIKDKESKTSNEELLRLIDNQVIASLDAQRTAEEQAMDNY